MWTVRAVPIGQVCLTPHTYNSVDLAVVLKYAALPADTAPPIDTVLKDGMYQIANGHHRYAAALIRGDSEIRVSFWYDDFVRSQNNG